MLGFNPGHRHRRSSPLLGFTPANVIAVLAGVCPGHRHRRARLRRCSYAGVRPGLRHCHVSMVFTLTLS